MKKATLYLLVFLQIIFMGIVNPCLSAEKNVQVNRVVVTFSPLIINNLNYTQKLFNIFAELTSKESELAQRLESSGALWSISQNLSGIQLSINSSSNKPEELNEIVEQILTKSLEKAEGIFNIDNQDIEPIDRLFLFFVAPEKRSSFPEKPLTICFYNSLGEEIENPVFNIDSLTENTLKTATNEAGEIKDNAIANIAASSIEKYCQLYKKAAKSNNIMNPAIQPVKNPILAKVLVWGAFTPANFISANYIKNKILFNPDLNGIVNAELAYNGTGLVLLLYNEIANNDYYEKYLKTDKAVDLAFQSPGPKEWYSWSSKLLEVMRNDRRNNMTDAMFSAWLKHWNAADFDTLPEKVNFVKPDKCIDIEVFANESQHSFYFSSDCYPVIYGCKSSDCKDGAYVGVCFEGPEHYIDCIEEFVRADFQITIPVSINKKNENNIVLGFFSPSNSIPVHLSRIKSAITDLLYTRFKVMDLKKDMKIGIAGVSSIPAYRMHGLLVAGWIPNTVPNKSRKAEMAELYELVQNTSYDNNILKIRWNNLVVSPQAKSILLAILASRNLTVDTWKAD